MIPYGRQDVTDADIEAVVEVLRSELITQGPAVPRFEGALAERCRAKFAFAMNSGTSALHVACMALRLGAGDTLWTVPNTFVASANCGRYCGAAVDFVDIDPLTWNISVVDLADRLVRAKREGRLPAVVVPVHFAGQPTQQEAIWELAREFGFKVLEDAAHSVGASRNGEPVGSCRWSHITAFSFHPVKIITTAEGGMTLTNDEELAWRMGVLRSHGVVREAERLAHASPGPWYYEQQMLGYNYRMTDVHAALGLSQLARLDELIDRRNALARRYDEALADLPLRLPSVESCNRSAFHIYVVRLDPARTQRSQAEVLNAMRARGIGVNLHYAPVHLQPYYRGLGFGPGTCPEAERYGRDAITLPLYPTLSDDAQREVVNGLREVL